MARLAPIPLLILAALASIAGCDGPRAPGIDPLDERDAGFDAGRPTDARPIASDGQPVDAAPAAPDSRPDGPPDTPVCPPFAAPPPVGDGLPDLRLQTTLSLGAPPGGAALWAGELDGDDATPEIAVIRGARLEVGSAAGDQWWRSAVLDLQRIVGPADLDGDGRLELIVAARRSVFVFDGLTGAIRWALPDAPFDGDRPTAIQQARALDLDGDGLDDLYISDSGCGDEGSGRATVWRFAEGFERPEVSGIDGPRLNGRCTRWHSFADLDDDGRAEVLVTDGDGLNGFALDGERRWCGRFDAPPNGPLPHVAGDGGWFVFLPDGVGWAAPTDDGPCEGGIELRWLLMLPELQVAGSAVVDGTALLTSHYDAEARSWRVIRVVDGAIQPVAPGARLLGVLGDRWAVVSEGDGPAPQRFGALQLYDLQAEPPAPVWPRPLLRARTIPTAAGADRTPELAGLLALDGDLVLLRAGAEDDTTERIDRIAPDGAAQATYPVTGEPGAIKAAGAGLVVAEAGGVVALLGPDLRPRFLAEDGRSPVRAAAGTPRLAVAFDGERPRPVAAIGGVVTLLDPDREAAPVRWQTAVGSPIRGGSPLHTVTGAEGPDGLLVRDARAGDAAWAVLSAADGHRRWRHRLDPADMRPVGEAVVVPDAAGRAALIARADLVLRPVRWSLDDASCAETILADRDPTAPADACPGFEVKPRVVRGLDPLTGACRWRLVLRPHWPCGGPSNQALSTADSDGDGRFELYLAETNAVRRIDPLSGALVGTIDLGFHANGAVRGGGWLRGAGALIRVGGNGPVEAFAADLHARWQAPHPEALRLQTWIGRDGALLDGSVWLSPAVGHPLMAWDVADGTPRHTWGLLDGALLDGAPFEPSFADIRGLTAVADVDGAGADGLLVTADDGVLYGLTAAGLAWSRPHDAAIGAPVVAPLAADTARSLLVPVGDGRALIYGPRGPAAPPVAWDLPCPPRFSCDADDDIDRTEALDRLCAAWVPVEGADGYELRPVGPNGARIGPWRPAPSPPATLSELPLVPGVRYAVEVRTVTDALGGRRRSAPRRTDGVEVINDPPPEIELAARPEALAPAEQPVVIAVRARDDDRLAGWRLEVFDRDGVRTRRLAGAPLATALFEETVRWNLEDSAKRMVPPGVYQIVGTVVDRAGHEARAEASVEVCDGDCP